MLESLALGFAGFVVFLVVVATVSVLLGRR